MNKLTTLLGSNPSILPWLTLAAIICLQSINGTNTSFPAYSSELKSRLHISQIQLNVLAAASDVGKLFGWCAGLGAARLPLWLVLAVGAAIGSVGYGLQYLFLAHKITQLAYWHVFLLNVLAGNSICWINTVCYIAAIRAFPADYGAVVSLSTSYAALSAKTYIALAQFILGTEPSDKSIYLLLNSAVPLAVCAIAAPFLREPDPLAAAAARTRGGLVAVFVIAGATGVYAVVETAVPVFGKLPRRLPPGILLIMVASIVLVPLWKV
uniref:Nodulin-like domain-containing protein n=1 Tax=Ananas comosus var. bracteatus TaxID=296719 RepID=A0A6V7NFY2_ANACO|nr:unnamed protein product [Ananas comosus var. bracteatus]